MVEHEWTYCTITQKLYQNYMRDLLQASKKYQRARPILLNNLLYKDIIIQVWWCLKNMGLNPETEIWVYPDRYGKWHAKFAIHNRVFVVYYDNKGCYKLSLEELIGFRINGTLISQKLTIQDVFTVITPDGYFQTEIPHL